MLPRDCRKGGETGQCWGKGFLRYGPANRKRWGEKETENHYRGEAGRKEGTVPHMRCVGVGRKKKIFSLLTRSVEGEGEETFARPQRKTGIRGKGR